MLCKYSNIKCESLSQIRSTVAEIKNVFLRGCFLLAHPVYSVEFAVFNLENIVRYYTGLCSLCRKTQSMLHKKSFVYSQLFCSAEFS